MINRLIFVTGLVLLCFSIASGIFLLQLLHSSHPAFQMIPLPQPGCACGGKAGGEIPTISEEGSSLHSLAIVGELPKQMDSSTSDIIEVKLTFTIPIPNGLLPYPSSNEGRNFLHYDMSYSLLDDMQNYCDLSKREFSTCYDNPPAVRDLFGPGYELFASAHLVATSFDVQPLGATEQPANQFSIVWDWNIFPKSAGNQPVNLDVDLHWKPVGNNGKEDVFRQIWEANPTITVNPPPFITPGQLTISGAVSAFFGLIFAGVSGPMILGKLKKRYEGKQQERVEQKLKQEQAKRERVELEQAERERVEQELARERAKRKPLEQELARERAAREQAERRLRRERARRGGSR